MKKRYIFLLWSLLIIMFYSLSIKTKASEEGYAINLYSGARTMYAPIENQNSSTNETGYTNTKSKDAFKLKLTETSNSQNQYNNTITNSYNSTIMRPEWYEFAPIEFENPVKCKGLYISFSCIDRNYWYKRKENFENYLRECDKRSGYQRDICYSKLREREYNLSNNFVPASQQFAQNMARQQQIDMQNKMIDAITKPQTIDVNLYRVRNW